MLILHYSIRTRLVPFFFSIVKSISPMHGLPTSSSSSNPSPTSDSRVANATGGDAGGQTPVAAKPAAYHRYPFYSPRFWHGMRPKAWWNLLRSGRFRVHPTRIGIVIGVTISTPVNMILQGIEWLFFRGRLREAELHGPPVFIVGHWRSGTTLLHELMVRDERLSSPSTYQCFAPHHFLVSQWFFRRFAGWLLPGKRPMDNMAAGWDRPQEDEFALLTLGLPSPYRRIAFPNEPPADMNYLDFDSISKSDVNVWLETLRMFLCKVSVSTGRPLVIKSPTHTGRIAALRERSRTQSSSTSRETRERCSRRRCGCGKDSTKCKRCRARPAKGSINTSSNVSAACTPLFIAIARRYRPDD